ncbi:hypothetical protein AWB73_01940 [Caballeronia turbans]|uniref:hypothetical protein n=1 Tax=Caballeronia sp. INSB1 TaxID=2921751 RepID=UPI00074C6DF0|nr:hypothetical protein [Caballeronia sp. INSB1]SAL25760.1 hypothetical protein AWB73_01940 [Caballeronia turbans]
MFRIDDPTAATSIPTPEAAGTEGFFTEGNPTAGTPATNVRGSWLNMIQEELRAVVVAGGLTPSKTTYNQVLSALNTLYGSGRLLNVRVIVSSGTYTPTAGTNSIVVEAVGGGGGGGGAPAVGASQISTGSPGSAGSYGIARFTSGFSGVTMTIGAAGAGGVGAAGTAGGTTSFGALLTCTGGLAGGVNAAGAGPTGFAGNSATPAGTGGQLNRGGAAGSVSLALGLSANLCTGGKGGDGPFGVGGGNVGGNVGGANAIGPGAGGGGTANAISSGALTGGSGSIGCIVIYEYA